MPPSALYPRYARSALQPQFLYECLEPRLGSERIHYRMNFEVCNPASSLSVCALCPIERSLIIAKPDVQGRQLDGRHVIVLELVLELRCKSLGVITFSCAR